MEYEPVAPISPEEARASLAEIDRIILLTRQSIARTGSAPIVIMWGVIWIIGYSATQFFPRNSGPFWAILTTLGIAGSALLGRAARNQTIRGTYGSRIGLSWLVLFAFAVIWVLVLGPADLAWAHQVHVTELLNRKIAAFWATVPMFAYVIMGLWLDRFFLWLGCLVTVATLFGYYAIHDYFFLWMAVVGGGSLIAGGLFIRKSWN